jgi:hypothetical protein
MGRQNYKIVIWAFLVLLLIIGILHFNYWTNRRYKEGFDTFKEGDAVELKLLATQGTNSYEIWVPGKIQSVNGNERYDVSIGNQLLKNQTELRAPKNSPQSPPSVIQVVAAASKDTAADTPSPSPAPAASNCAPYTPISTVSSIFDSIRNQHTNSELDIQIDKLSDELSRNSKITQIIKTCQNKNCQNEIVPLLNLNIDESTMKQILQDPVIAIITDPKKNTPIIEPLTHITRMYILKIMEYMNNYIVKNDLFMQQTLDANYSSNLRLFVTNVNTFISGNKNPMINQIVQNAFKKAFNADQTDLNSAITNAFVSNTPGIQNPEILLKNVCNILFQMGNEILTIVSQFIKYYIPSDSRNKPTTKPL